MTTRINRRKFISGEVISDKMDKTRVVQIDWTVKHDKYYKTVRRTKRCKAHDEKNESKKGDTVKIMETRPLSKDKRWVVLEVLKANN